MWKYCGNLFKGLCLELFWRVFYHTSMHAFTTFTTAKVKELCLRLALLILEHMFVLHVHVQWSISVCCPRLTNRNYTDFTTSPGWYGLYNILLREYNCCYVSTIAATWVGRGIGIRPAWEFGHPVPRSQAHPGLQSGLVSTTGACHLCHKCRCLWLLPFSREAAERPVAEFIWIRPEVMRIRPLAMS